MGPESTSLPADLYSGFQLWPCVTITWELAKIIETQTLNYFPRSELLFSLLAF